MVGTAADPARIGPFKILKEVHWPGQLVFRITLKAQFTGGSGDPCTPPIDIIPDGYAQVYADTSRLVYEDAPNPNAAWRRSAGEWVSTTVDDLENMPDISATEVIHGYLNVGFFEYPWINGIDGAALTGPELPLVPEEAGTGRFTHGLGIEFQILGNVMTGGILCYLPSVFPRPVAFETRAYGPQSVLHTEPFDLTDVIAREDGKAYRPIATRLLFLPVTDGPEGSVEVYVLCKRSPADDEEPT